MEKTHRRKSLWIKSAFNCLSFASSPISLCRCSEQSSNDQSWRFPQSQWSTSQAGPPAPIIKAIASALTCCGAACYFPSASSIRVHPEFPQWNYFGLLMLKKKSINNSRTIWVAHEIRAPDSFHWQTQQGAAASACSWLMESGSNLVFWCPWTPF